MSTKKTSTTFDIVEAIACICVLSGFILSTSSYSVNVSADVFHDGQMETVKCQINNSILDIGNCPLSIMPVEYLEILLTKNSKTTRLCTFRSFRNCALLSQDSIVNSCGCYPEGNTIYVVNVTVTADRNTFDGAIIDCYPNCINSNSNYPFQSTYNGIPIAFENAFAADASVYCPDKGFADNTVTYLTGSFNSSILTTGKCVFGVSVMSFVFIKGTSSPVLLCRQSFSTSPPKCNTTFTTQNCKCDNVTGEMFYYTYRFTTNANVHEGGVIELRTDCEDISGQNPLTMKACNITFMTTTTASTITERNTTVETTASTTQVTTSHGHHDITCTESRMEFSIPLSSPHTSETATLSDPNCQINLTRTHVRGGVDLNSCGTTVQFQNDSVIFRNAIIFSAPASSSLGSNGSDDSVSQYQDIIPIECVYNRIATVHLSYMPVVRRVLFTESGVGQFSFNIQQFWDASFTSVVSDRAYPLRLEQDADIFIQLSVGSEGQPVAGHKEIGMEVQQCLVSPSSSVIEAQLHYYPLIQDGCPASSDVHIIPNTNASDSTVMRFRFRAVNFFDPSSSSSSSLVFVHCRMGLCLTGSCKPSAWTCLTPPARRVRRDVDQSRRAAHQLSTGPFLIMADEASASSSSTTATVMAVVSTSVATVAIVVAAIALIALRRRRTTARN